MYHEEQFAEYCKKLGLRIKTIREEKLITISDLSKKTGIRTEYIRKIEQGKAYGVLIKKHLLKIAIGLNIKMSDLFDI